MRMRIAASPDKLTKGAGRRGEWDELRVIRPTRQLRDADAALRPAELADRVHERFGRSVHPRSVERALARREKKRR